MPEKNLLLTGRVIAYVRHMSPEEMAREEWTGPPPVALVLDNGAVLYAGLESSDQLDAVPGHLMAQHQGLMWNLKSEAERSVSRYLANNILRRTQMAAWIIGGLMALTSVLTVVLGVSFGEFGWTHVGPGALGQLLGAALCLVLASLVGASRLATSDPHNTTDQMIDKRARARAKAKQRTAA